MNRPNPNDIPRELVEARRNAVLERLDGGVMVLPAAPVQRASGDAERPYHPDRELYYVTGATEPESVAVLVGGDEPRLVLFVRERDEAAELWSGARLGVDGAMDRLGPDECRPIGELAEELPELLWQGREIYYRLGRGDAVEPHVVGALGRGRTKGARSGSGPRRVIDPGEILDDLRLIKDAYEIEAIRTAVDISLDAHRAAARVIAPGAGEWVVEAALEGAFRAGGGSGAAYEPIVGSGANACVLHYVSNGDVIAREDLVLVDAGAEWGLYNGDVTRTYPAGGRFEGVQLHVYEVVEAARRAAVATISPGATIQDVHDAATRTLIEGLVSLGVLSGDVSEIRQREGHRPYFPHQTSHWLGLDVHDPADYARAGSSRVLEPGMVLTVEPGLYFRPGLEGRDDLSGIGVRIEDDVLVTPEGCEVLTGGLPTEPADVEALMAEGR